MFERVYDSAWHHPGAAWIAGVAVLALLIRLRRVRSRKLFAIAVIIQVAIMVDAWFTGAWAPIAKGATLQALAIAFVILGDLRFFLLLEYFGRRARLSSALTRALGWGLLIPILSNVARWLWPDNVRVLFLTYELMFAALALGMRFVILPRYLDAKVTGAQRRWLTGLASYEFVQYAFWATADIIILSGIDAGLLVRLVPNMLYYVGFVAFAFVTAPTCDSSSTSEQEP